jgi:hypothetical protein
MKCELRSVDDYRRWYRDFQKWCSDSGVEIATFLIFCLYVGWISIGIICLTVLSGIWLSGTPIVDPWYTIAFWCGPAVLFLARLPLFLVCRNFEVLPGARYLLSFSK